MLAIDDVLQGRYRIVRQLGHGGMGAIYVGEDSKRFGKLVALKEILLDPAKAPNQQQHDLFRHAFEREAKLLTQLEHDAFPQVIEYFLETDRQFLVMELIHGEDLGEMLNKSKKPFPLKEVLKWTDQLLDALDYLHTLASPIIHRDIKPQNIKLTAKGKIKLLDFGIAKGQETRGGIHHITNQTFIGASLHYSPIEQLFRVIDQGYRNIILEKFTVKAEIILNQTADARTDLYALGSTLYHLLTAQVPADALERALAVWAGKPDPLQTPQQVNPQIPAEISAWLLKTMAIECEDRFDSALEMQNALQEIISNEKRRKEDEKKQEWLKEKEELERKHALQLRQIEEEHQQQAKLESQSIHQQETLPEDVAPVLEKDLKTANESRSSIPQPLIVQSKALAVPVIKDSMIESSFAESPQNDFSAEFTAPSYLPENFSENEKEEIVPPISTAEKSLNSTIQPKKNMAGAFLIAAVAVLLLGIAAMGMFILFSGSNDKNVNKPSNTSAVIPTAAPLNSPKPSPTISPTISPSASPTPSPLPTQNNINQAIEKSKPTIAPAIEKTPLRSNPVKDQPRTAPKPSKTPNRSDDCIYNRRCG